MGGALKDRESYMTQKSQYGIMSLFPGVTLDQRSSPIRTYPQHLTDARHSIFWRRTSPDDLYNLRHPRLITTTNCLKQGLQQFLLPVYLPRTRDLKFRWLVILMRDLSWRTLGVPLLQVIDIGV
ncbi:uncharacterized protein N7483_010815 [Penicillium malachiteum]|uniref:uncharacterized protein n=1 Tax=Penicillium malachiteum TaxID=1324776 RepID=UPI0025478015|nr:uncharacterized protein N7483_010815 [Penicillium malachiteum]KAJ5713634.1 hypothetical protein N7483_010815 [Penicillium malachiteum]